METGAAARLATVADNYQELLQLYSPTQQATIKAWYTDFSEHSMAFGNHAQWQWMQQHDYPTPDDVLRASRMSDAQLHDLATGGYTKANFFYLARLIDDYTMATQRSYASGNITELRTKLSASMNRALASGSPFAGYMFKHYYATLHGRDVAGVGAACGFAWASGLGDSRALFANPRALMDFPSVSGTRAAEVYFDMYARAARINPYFLNAYRGRANIPSRWQR